MFANNFPAKVTILERTPWPTYLHFSLLWAPVFAPSLEETLVPHSASTAHIKASPKLHLLTDDDGL